MGIEFSKLLSLDSLVSSYYCNESEHNLFPLFFLSLF